MKLRQLRTLLAIAENRTFANAAEIIGLTQSAVSLQVKHLEQELGVVLFDRATRPPRLNSAGLALIEQARQVVEICDQIATVSRDRRIKGTIAFGAVPTSANNRMPSALVSVRTTHPELRIRMSIASSIELAARVGAGELDAALVSEPVQFIGDLTIHKITDEPLCVIAPSNAEGNTDREILEALPFIQFNKRAWTGQLIDEELAARAIRVDSVVETDSMEAITQMVQHGLGASVIPVHGAGPGTLAGLKKVPFGDPPIFRNLVVVERSDGTRGTLVRALVDVLREQVHHSEN